MWRRVWSGANPSVVSPMGRGFNVRGMGGKCSRGGTHSSTALSGSRGGHDGDGSHSCWRGCSSGSSGWRGGGDKSSGVGATGRGRGGTVHPGLKSASSAGLHHATARGGEEMERGASETGNRMLNEKERKKRGFYKGRGPNERSWPINGLKFLLNGWFKKKGS